MWNFFAGVDEAWNRVVAGVCVVVLDGCFIISKLFALDVLVDVAELML